MGEVTSFDINSLRRDVQATANKVDAVSQEVVAVGAAVATVGVAVTAVNGELQSLRDQFLKFVEDQKKDNIMQQAQAELLRVRQELALNFGNYKLVRDTMIGILQSTDAMLVKQETITRISEELMLQQSTYWLAPCVVAVAAWIGNDRALAERAIREAVKRDEEQTALTMALICRRNGRTETCYEWLAIYFSKQSAKSFTENTYTFLDAYLNGVFGPDEKHVCDDYISKWITELKGNDSEFDEHQTQRWDEYCLSYYSSTSVRFPALAALSPQFKDIDAYLGRICSADNIYQKFDTMAAEDVDKNALAESVDSKLTELIQKYDAKERPLREAEEYYLAVCKAHGDEEVAKLMIADKHRKMQEQTVDLLEQMAKAIESDDKDAVSKRKTAISFLRGHINSGFNKYITEKKADFPDTIIISLDGYNTAVKDPGECPRIIKEYERYCEVQKDNELSEILPSSIRTNLIIAVICAVLGLIGIATMPLLGVIAIVCAIVFGIKSFKARKNSDAQRKATIQHYAELIDRGKRLIAKAMTEWDAARKMAEEYETKEHRELVS